MRCWQVENQCVGAPCGVMDQMAVTPGQQGALMALLCQPAELQPPVQIPPNVRFWGVDSGALTPHQGVRRQSAARCALQKKGGLKAALIPPPFGSHDIV